MGDGRCGAARGVEVCRRVQRTHKIRSAVLHDGGWVVLFLHRHNVSLTVDCFHVLTCGFGAKHDNWKDADVMFFFSSNTASSYLNLNRT